MQRANTTWNWDDGETLAEAYDLEAGLSQVLGQSVEEIAPEAVQDWFHQAVSRMSDVESFSIGNALREVGKQFGDGSELRKVVGGVLPVVGTAVGTMYGGPVGAAIGGQIGQVAGQVVGGKASRPAASVAPAPAVATPAYAAPAMSPEPTPAPFMEPVATAAPTAPGAAATPAAAPTKDPVSQLLYFARQPHVLQTLLRMALGREGDVTVGSTPISGDDVINGFQQLALKAAARSGGTPSAAEAVTPAYELDSEGRFLGESTPAYRAQSLLELLQRADEERLFSAEAYSEAVDDWNPEL